MRGRFKLNPKKVAGTAMIAFPIIFIISIPWLEEQSGAVVQIFGGIAATGTVIASQILAVLRDKDLDEWQRSAARFSNQWGWLTGGGLVAILLGLPYFKDLVVYVVTFLSSETGHPDLMIKLAFTFGFMFVIFTQMICTTVLSYAWRNWMTKTDAE